MFSGLWLVGLLLVVLVYDLAGWAVWVGILWFAGVVVSGILLAIVSVGVACRGVGCWFAVFSTGV